MKKTVTLFAILALTFASAQNQRPTQGEKRTPPQEAISACENKSEGASCSMTTPRDHTIEGTCTNTPDGKYFACKPNNPPRGRQQ